MVSAVPASTSAPRRSISSSHASAAPGSGSPSRLRPIPVWNGDTVEIAAREHVCPSSKDECFDANGAPPGRWEGYSYFKGVPHASLVAAVPGEGIPIGVHRVFRVSQSGWVLLFVNDDDVGNNTGGFEVRAVVTPPR